MNLTEVGKTGAPIKLHYPTYGNPPQWVASTDSESTLGYAGGKLKIVPGREYGYPEIFPKSPRTMNLSATLTERKAGITSRRISFEISGYEEIPLDGLRFSGGLWTSVPFGSPEFLQDIVGGTDGEGLKWGCPASPRTDEMYEFLEPVYDAVSSRFQQSKCHIEKGVAITGTFKDDVKSKKFAGKVGKVRLYAYVLDGIQLRPKVLADADGTALIAIPVRGSVREEVFPSRAISVEGVPYHVVLLDMASDDPIEAAEMGAEYTVDDLSTFFACDIERISFESSARRWSPVH